MELTFGQKLARRRMELGLQQKDIAQRMGVTAPYVSMYERDSKVPKLSTIRKFASALECSVYDLIDVDDSDAANSEPEPFIPPLDRLDAATKELNVPGQSVIADIAEGLAQLPRYRKASDTSSTPSSEPEE